MKKPIPLDGFALGRSTPKGDRPSGSTPSQGITFCGGRSNGDGHNQKSWENWSRNEDSVMLFCNDWTGLMKVDLGHGRLGYYYEGRHLSPHGETQFELFAEVTEKQIFDVHFRKTVLIKVERADGRYKKIFFQGLPRVLEKTQWKYMHIRQLQGALAKGLILAHSDILCRVNLCKGCAMEDGTSGFPLPNGQRRDILNLYSLAQQKKYLGSLFQ